MFKKIVRKMNIGKQEFIALCQKVGGLDDAALVQAYEDPNMKPMWIKMEMAGYVSPRDPSTLEGLQALEALGYISEGTAQAILDAWPKL